MASKSAKKSSKPSRSAKKAAPKRKPTEQTASAPKGDHVRMLAPKKAVVNFVSYVRSCKTQTSEAGQRLTSATKAAQDAGVNIPAARLAERFVAAAFRDSLKGRTLFEDTLYYLECLEFDTMAPAGLFKASEVHSTKAGSRSRKKKGADAEPAQADLAERTDAGAGDDAGESTDAPPMAAASEDGGDHIVVH